VPTWVVLELGDLDVILEAVWMRRFGKVAFDWKGMILSFPWQGKMENYKFVGSW